VVDKLGGMLTECFDFVAVVLHLYYFLHLLPNDKKIKKSASLTSQLSKKCINKEFQKGMAREKNYFKNW